MFISNTLKYIKVSDKNIYRQIERNNKNNIRQMIYYIIFLFDHIQ